MISAFDVDEPLRPLPDISQAKPLTAADRPLIDDLIVVLKKHNALSRFGLSLLHQHFEIGDDEVLVEATNIEKREQTIQPCKKLDVRELPVVETAWRLDTGKPIMSCACVIKDQHMHLPVQCDGRLKDRVAPLDKGLQHILALKPVSFHYTREARQQFGLPDRNMRGFIAEEMEEILPDAVFDDYRGTKHKAIDFAAIIPTLVNAIQEQQAIIDKLVKSQSDQEAATASD